MTSTPTRIILFSFFFLLFVPYLTSAETKIFVKEYTYHAGDEDSRNSSRTIALREVKRLLLEELGVYLESQTEVINFQMTKDQITTLTAGIVSAEVIEDTWNGKVYFLKAKIAADPQDVIKAIDNLRNNREKVKELEGARKQSEELLRENERLRKELQSTETGKKKAVEQAYKQNIDNLSATEWAEKGDKFDISSNYNDAIAAFSTAIKLHHQKSWIGWYYYKRGAIYFKLGKYQQAIKDFNKTLELDPGNPNAFLKREIIYFKLGKYQQDIKDYSKAIKLNPQNAKAYLNRGFAYLKLKNYQEALKDYNKAIVLNPQNAEAYKSRGIAYLDLPDNHDQQALNDFNKAIELDPKNGGHYYRRAILYGDLGHDQEALKDYNKAIVLNPQDPESYEYRASFYWRRGDYEKAIADYKYADSLGSEKENILSFKHAARDGDEGSKKLLRSAGIEW